MSRPGTCAAEVLPENFTGPHSKIDFVQPLTIARCWRALIRYDRSQPFSVLLAEASLSFAEKSKILEEL